MSLQVGQIVPSNSKSHEVDYPHRAPIIRVIHNGNTAFDPVSDPGKRQDTPGVSWHFKKFH